MLFIFYNLKQAHPLVFLFRDQQIFLVFRDIVDNLQVVAMTCLHFHLLFSLYRLFVRLFTARRPLARGVFPTICSEFSTRNVCWVAQLIAQISWGWGTTSTNIEKLDYVRTYGLHDCTPCVLTPGQPRPLFSYCARPPISSTFPLARDVHMLRAVGHPEWKK